MKRILITLAFGAVLSTSSFAVNLLSNAGFESGGLGPWFQARDFGGPENWNVTGTDFNSGAFSATDVGNKELRQDFAPTLTSLITEISVWIKNPDTQINFISFHYSDFTEGGQLVSARSASWEHYDVTSSLDAGKTLVGIGLWGYLGGSAAEDRSFYDDAVVNSSVPEPATMAVLGLGVAALLRRRRQAQK